MLSLPFSFEIRTIYTVEKRLDRLHNRYKWAFIMRDYALLNIRMWLSYTASSLKLNHNLRKRHLAEYKLGPLDALQQGRHMEIFYMKNWHQQIEGNMANKSHHRAYRDKWTVRELKRVFWEPVMSLVYKVRGGLP